jgi:hypothetical protein
VSRGLGLYLPERGALGLPRVPRLRAVPFWEGSSSAAICPTTPDGLWTTGIKKDLAVLGTQLGSRVSKARSCVTEAPEDVQAAIVRPYSAASAQLTTPEQDYSGDVTRQDGIMGLCPLLYCLIALLH